MHDQPDLNDDEAEVLVITAYTCAHVVANIVERYLPPHMNAIESNADPRESILDDLQCWYGGLPDGMVVSQGGIHTKDAPTTEIVQINARELSDDPTTDVEPDSPPSAESQTDSGGQSEGLPTGTTEGSWVGFQPLIEMPLLSDLADVTIPSPLCETINDASVLLLYSDESLQSFAYPVSE